MANLAIFSILFNLILLNEAKFWKPNEDFAHPEFDKYKIDESEDRLTSLPYCDSVGSRIESLMDLSRTGRRCYCNPRFYGERCERIFRCESGRPINVTCDNPPKRFELAASTRCVDGQVNLEVCDCFEGYTGHLCSEIKGLQYPSFVPIQGVEGHVPFQETEQPLLPYRRKTVSEHQEYEMAKRYIEREEKLNRIGNYKMALFVVDVFVFVAVIMCMKTLWARASMRQTNTPQSYRLINFLRETEYLSAHPEVDENSTDISREPPTYEDVMKRAEEIKETSPPAPSYAVAISRSLERSLEEPVVNPPTVPILTTERTIETAIFEEPQPEEMAENSEEMQRTERRLQLHV